ncbi:radical SAM family heme chaperone HemW [Paracidobacterium acidisoli]|uniref:Heme chaperone HemW n=1 Tax=Paracidobacterium acidisoli TaxID=2303751 RepID=A0A372IT18_9BACT|nr:radical SAM family heme chaperone HemW [Paracidobacterium acidisoli]MBT9329501.1 radical SAM family heme chaperone HemW [Paracidobacterium acidisoli]
METLGLYISVPFCRSKCTYCNFASGVFPSSYFEQYTARLEADLHTARAQAAAWGAVLPAAADTIYFGGGTPSILPAELVRRIFSAIRGELTVMPDAEITVECAPGQLEEATLAAFAAAGVNRISFGVQSFIDREAALTGRLHNRAIALEDIRRVRTAGISNISLDLIAGLPGQTAASWRESLAVLADTGVDHASIYMLEVDDDSRLGREIGIGGLRYHAVEIPSDDAIADFYIEGVAFLAGQGMMQYEISNFVRTGAQADHSSRHNLKYWQRAPYLGIGVDAHSMLRTGAGQALRFATTDELEPFLAAAGWNEPHWLTRREELEEAWFLGLRLNQGVSLTALCEEFGAENVGEYVGRLRELESEGLVVRSRDHVALTAQGRLLSNEVFGRFLEERAAAV